MHLLPISLAVSCILSLAVDTLAAPHPNIFPGAHIELSRRSQSKRRSPEDIAASLQRRKRALEAKYGVGHARNQKRASGMNL